MDLLLDSRDTKKDDDANIVEEENKLICLRIRTNESVDSSIFYNLSIEQSCSVLQLKEAVRNKLGPAARGRYLRLVCQGRLLAPDRSKLSDFQLKPNTVVHAVLAAPGVRGGHQAALSRGSSSSNSRRRFRGIGVGADGLVIPRNSHSNNNNNTSDSSSDDDDDDSDLEEGRAGFDRLRDNGMSRSEVEVIRAYFSRQVDRFREQQQQQEQQNQSEHTTSTNNSNTTTNTGARDNNSNSNSNGNSNPVTAESIRRERLHWEDQWMDLQGPSSEFRLNLNTNNPLLSAAANARGLFGSVDLVAAAAATRTSLGTDRDFGWGFFLGFFMGFVMMFWVWMPTVPHKQKLGILTGICFQMTLNMLRNRSYNDLEE